MSETKSENLVLAFFVGDRISKNPHPEGWGYTDEARLRGLIQKTDFLQPDWVSAG